MAPRAWPVVLLLAFPAGAAEPGAAALDEAERAFERADFAAAVSASSAALRGELTDSEKKRAWELQAFSQAAYGREAESIEAFRRVLSLDPVYELAPDQSPRLVKLLSKARAQGPLGEAPPKLEPPPPVPPPHVEQAGPSTRKLGWVTAAAGAGVAAASGICFIVSNGQYQSLTGSPHLSLSQAASARDEGKLFQTLGAFGAIAGGVALAVGGTLYFAGGEGGAVSASLSPAGLAVAGRF